MPYYWNDTNTELRLNTAFTHGGTSFPRQWLQRSTEAQRTEIGLVWRDAPVYKNEAYYRNYLLMDGTVKSDPLPVDGLRVRQIEAIKKAAASKLVSSDWMVVRAAEGGTAVPQDWADWRVAIRAASNAAEAAVGAADFEGLQVLQQDWPESPEEKNENALRRFEAVVEGLLEEE
tara:strand:+ start:1092 stop:1613 length:522 start_codon:yes stop_codon:yes gene_type:complete